MNIDVVVPAPSDGIRAVVQAGAGCVMVERAGMYLLYHQSDTGAVNLMSYADRVRVAAYRARDRAPTHAVISIGADQAHIIGRFDTERDVLTIHDRERLAEWLDTPSVAGPEHLEFIFEERPEPGA